MTDLLSFIGVVPATPAFAPESGAAPVTDAFSALLDEVLTQVAVVNRALPDAPSDFAAGPPPAPAAPAAPGTPNEDAPPTPDDTVDVVAASVARAALGLLTPPPPPPVAPAPAPAPAVPTPTRGRVDAGTPRAETPALVDTTTPVRSSGWPATQTPHTHPVMTPSPPPPAPETPAPETPAPPLAPASITPSPASVTPPFAPMTPPPVGRVDAGTARAEAPALVDTPAPVRDSGWPATPTPHAPSPVTPAAPAAALAAAPAPATPALGGRIDAGTARVETPAPVVTDTPKVETAASATPVEARTTPAPVVAHAPTPRVSRAPIGVDSDVEAPVTPIRARETAPTAPPASAPPASSPPASAPSAAAPTVAAAQAAQPPTAPHTTVVEHERDHIHGVGAPLRAAVREMPKDRPNTVALTIRLDPPELGEVKVRVVAHGDRVQVTLHTDSPEARVALEQRHHDVADLLRHDGFNLDAFDVESRDEPKREQQPERARREPPREDDADQPQPDDELRL